MKKSFISVLLCVIFVFGISACGKQADPIVLPDVSDIVSVDITIEENTLNHTNEVWIKEIIFNIEKSEPADKESVQDIPRVDHYIKIDIHFEKGTSTLFAYEDDGTYYVEQPYQGIYEVESSLYQQLQETE